jgi:hypothetical protein
MSIWWTTSLCNLCWRHNDKWRQDLMSRPSLRAARCIKIRSDLEWIWLFLWQLNLWILRSLRYWYSATFTLCWWLNKGHYQGHWFCWFRRNKSFERIPRKSNLEHWRSNQRCNFPSQKLLKLLLLRQDKLVYTSTGKSVMWDGFYIEASVYNDEFTRNRILLYYYEEPVYNLSDDDSETPANLVDDIFISIKINPRD